MKKTILTLQLLCCTIFVHAQTIELTKWQIKNTSEVKESDVLVSKASYTPANWYDAMVPTTVLNALVKQKVYLDPRMGLNNYLIPDVSDEFNAKHDLHKYNYLNNGRNPWKDPYWYRTEISLPESYKGKKVWLNLYGINYRADVWVNGHLIADKDSVYGMFRRFRLDVTKYVYTKQKNCVAIKIYQVDHPGIPDPGTQLKVFGPVRGHAQDIFKDETLKLSGGWDCAPVVRDRNMGIYQKVTLESTGDVILENPFIVTTLPQKDTTVADVNIKLELKNTSDIEFSGVVDAQITLVNEVKFPSYIKHMEGSLKPILVSKSIRLKPGEKRLIELDSHEFKSLLIAHPYLWYPNGYGQQYLHHIKLTVGSPKSISDLKEFDFGIREVKKELKRIGDEAGLVYYINGRKVFCKGGWIQPDILLDNPQKRIYDEVRLMAEANINIIGSEDMPAPDETWLDCCDKYGLMWWHVFYQCWRTYPGTETEHYPLDHSLAIAGVEDIIRRYRNHPSIITWFGVNEVLPDEHLYKLTKQAVMKLDSTRPYIPTTSTSWDIQSLTPYMLEDYPTGTTDDGAPDYTWEQSSYFFDKIREVHLQMFRNELGMPSIPLYSSLKKFIPTIDHLDNVNSPIFPLDSIWAEHGAWDVNNYCYRSYDNAIRTLMGDPKSGKAYSQFGQILSADGYRAMFEAANHRMWDITSGVMIWKINSCWPDVCWQIYDWYLNPNASYYFAKKAMEPVHIQLNANDFKVSLVNATYSQLKNVVVTAKVISRDLKTLWSSSQTASIDSNCYHELFEIPRRADYDYNYFVKLELRSSEGKLLSDNLYWFYSQHADYSWLAALEKPLLERTVKVKKEMGEYVYEVKLANKSSKLSFFNHLALTDESGEEILPVFWSDNFITLFPGEEKTLIARFAATDAHGKLPGLLINGD